MPTALAELIETMTYDDGKVPSKDEEKKKFMHAYLKGPNFHLMASDTHSSMPSPEAFNRGNTYSIAINYQSDEEIERLAKNSPSVDKLQCPLRPLSGLKSLPCSKTNTALRLC